MNIAACGGALIGAGAAMAAGQEEALAAVPSGLQLSVADQFLEKQPDGTTWARFRFVAPEIGDGVGVGRVGDDFLHLCDKYALPRLENLGLDVSQVVISMSSKDVEFGATAPDIVQFFDAFSVETGRCIWEAF
ncbi:MAG: DUF6497 family protein [Thalassovita sp.]|nr:DUF6497 family protein [Thalassovita sp.]